MIKGKARNIEENINYQSELDNILTLAKQAYENYIIRSNNQDLETAIDCYIKVMNLDPNIPETYYKLAGLLLQKGDIDLNTAIAQCQNAIDLDPKSSDAHLQMGYFLQMAGNFEGAEEKFGESIKLSRWFSSRSRFAMALILIKKMRALNPTFSDFSKAMYYFASGMVSSLWDYSTLRILYKTLLDNFYVFVYKLTGSIFKKINGYNLAIKTYEDAIEKTGRSELFYSRIAEVSLKKGEPHIAVECYKKALSINPDNVSLWKKLASTLEAYYQEDIELITDCYRNLAEFEPENARLFYELGHLYIKLEDILSAINSFKKAIELDEDNPFYHNSLGYSLIQINDFDGAISEYQKAIKLNPDNQWTSVVCQALASIYYQVKQSPDAAIATYQTAIMLDDKCADTHLALGNIYHDLNDLDKAIDCYCEAIKNDPFIAKAYCNLGLALWEKDYTEEAIVAYNKAIMIDDEYAIAYNNLGVAYLDGTGEIEKSIDCFEKAIKYNPNYTLAYYNCGRAYEAYGSNTTAAEFYQMAYDLNVITEELNAREIEDRLYHLFDA